jgi:uncharacterized membrane-anchored protein YhcB (DUF1043 family)
MARQVIGSLLVAAAIVAIAIVVVTARLGPTSVAEQEAREERLDQRIDAREQVRKDREDALKEARDRDR